MTQMTQSRLKIDFRMNLKWKLKMKLKLHKIRYICLVYSYSMTHKWHQNDWKTTLKWNYKDETNFSQKIAPNTAMTWHANDTRTTKKRHPQLWLWYSCSSSLGRQPGYTSVCDVPVWLSLFLDQDIRSRPSPRLSGANEKIVKRCRIRFEINLRSVVRCCREI